MPRAPNRARPRAGRSVPKPAARGARRAKAVPRAATRDRGAETRTQLIETALDVFGELGFAGASTRLIASKAGVNLAAITYHFGSKQALHVAVARYIAERIAASIGPALAIATAADSITSADAARRAILTMLDLFIDVILGKAEAARWARFVVREQMHPTAAFDVLYEFMEGATAAATGLVARALGRPDNAETRLRMFAILGQVMFFRVAQAVVMRRMNWKAIDDAERAAIKRVVLSHVDDILLAERTR